MQTCFGQTNRLIDPQMSDDHYNLHCIIAIKCLLYVTQIGVIHNMGGSRHILESDNSTVRQKILVG